MAPVRSIHGGGVMVAWGDGYGYMFVNFDDCTLGSGWFAVVVGQVGERVLATR